MSLAAGARTEGLHFRVDGAYAKATELRIEVHGVGWTPESCGGLPVTQWEGELCGG